jgi:alkylation response protein AidB-like acyl-CoA dehydrogenase
MSINFMVNERATIERLLPGLDQQLREVGLTELESSTSPGLRLFREHAGPGLVVPEELGGLGASIVDALHVQRVLGARSPSLAIAVNMHLCTVIAMPPGQRPRNCSVRLQQLGFTSRRVSVRASRVPACSIR